MFFLLLVRESEMMCVRSLSALHKGGKHDAGMSTVGYTCAGRLSMVDTCGDKLILKRY